MIRGRQELIYPILLALLVLSGGILGFFSWRSAARWAELGEEAIVASTLLLVKEKVELIEQYVIDQDNTVMGMINFSDPQSISRTWRTGAAEISPSVRAVVVLGPGSKVLAHSVRGSEEDERTFLDAFLTHILPEMDLASLAPGALTHWHEDVQGVNYLISYKALYFQGRLHYVILHHDSHFISRQKFPQLFTTQEGRRLYNVAGKDNVRVFGPDLSEAGDYLVGHRFPTTLYGWRLQVAPRQAKLLDAQGRYMRFGELGMIGTALTVLLVGLFFLVYAGWKDRRLSLLKSEFIANVSHELKTPLSAIKMFGELLLSKRVASEAKRDEYVSVICRESERLTALIENVLDFAAVERGKQVYEMRDGDLREIAARAIEMTRFRADRGKTNISLIADSELPVVRLDEQAMMIAIVNLIDNAVKYGEGSAVEVHLHGVGDDLVVSVRDHGPGIPPEDGRRIFQRFYRARRGHVRGSGIGLSLVKQIAEAHGGRAWAENAKGGGAQVSLSLPAHAA